MIVTVAICTRNRRTALRNTLASLTRVDVPAGVDWEVLVIDNGSTDGTAELLPTFAGRLPLRVVNESRAGKSNAANSAIRESRGAYVLWLDDDVIVDVQWLAAYCDAFQQGPDVAFFGGPITPVFEGTPPPWLRAALKHLGNAYAAIDLGREVVALEGESLPYGANWAIRMAEQRTHQYDPALGRRGTLLLAGEEWAVMQEVLRNGGSGRWVPDAHVQHVIPPGRQSLRYLRRYYVGNGYSHAGVQRYAGDVTLFGRPRWLWREAFVQELAFRVRRLYAAPDVWSEHFRRAGVAWGMLRLQPGAESATADPGGAEQTGSST